jgi:hypothetical protein
VFVGNFLAIDEVTEKLISEAAAKDFGVALGGEEGFVDCIDSGLDFRCAFVNTEPTYSTSLVSIASALLFDTVTPWRP